MKTQHSTETRHSYGPDRATYRHWLDRESRPVQGIADCLKTAHAQFGHPNAGIARTSERTVYAWQIGFDRFAFTVYRKSA